MTGLLGHPALVAEIDEVLGLQQKQIATKAMMAVTKGELTPELAQQLWLDWNAIDRLGRALKARHNDRAQAHLTRMAS